jgi:isopenicillin-N epimerase
MSSPHARHWTLDPSIEFLNHGSFGACPRAVLEAQAELRAEMERRPVEFLARRLPALIDAAREKLAAFVGADPDGLVPVVNATTGVNTVLRSLDLAPGDELVVTDHAYNACRNALVAVAHDTGAVAVVARVPFPLRSSDEVVEAVLAAVTPRTKLALIDHVTSPTGLVFPVEALLARLAERGIDALVDGAHAPGMIALDLRRLAAPYYVGNCHKWLCAPKSAGFLWARADRRGSLRPLVTSHGANTHRPGRSRLHDMFDWTGTEDPTAFLCVPAAIDALGGMLPGGWPAVMEHNRALALAARRILIDALSIEAPSPEAMLGSLATVPLPDAPHAATPELFGLDPLHAALLGRHIEVPIVLWPAPPRRFVRVSAQLYNDEAQYHELAAALRAALGSC